MGVGADSATTSAFARRSGVPCYFRCMKWLEAVVSWIAAAAAFVRAQVERATG
jgi:hypothetical protein